MKKIFFYVFTVVFLNQLAVGQNIDNCECKPTSFNMIENMRRMNLSERQEFLTNNCYKIVRTTATVEDPTYQDFTKCNLKKVNMKDSSISYKGDYTIKLINENSILSIRYSTTISKDFQDIVETVMETGYEPSTERGVTFYRLPKFNVSYWTSTRTDGMKIYNIQFHF